MARAVIKKKVIVRNSSSGSGGGGGSTPGLNQVLAVDNTTNGYPIQLDPDGLGYSSIITAGSNMSFSWILSTFFAYILSHGLFIKNAISSHVFFHIEMASNFFCRMGSSTVGNGMYFEMDDAQDRAYIANDANNVAFAINKLPVSGIDLDVNGIINVQSDAGLKIANVQLYQEEPETTYSGTITWDGTAPTTILNQTYRWTRIGKMVSLRINIKYSVAGTTNTIATVTLPTGAPTPQDPAGFGNANDVAVMATGSLGTNTGAISGSTTKAFLGQNATATGHICTVSVNTAINAKVFRFSIDYFTA